MALSDAKIREYTQRLLISRMRILCNHGFFGLLLMHMRYGVDEETETAYTDGERIVFGSDFLEKLSESELDFVMMHEVMHVALQHCFRGLEYDAELFNIACDIVVNSNILLENGMKTSSITLNEYGESMHVAPDGKEGHEYTAEEVYQMLLKECTKLPRDKKKSHLFDDHSKWDKNDNGDSEKSDLWNKRVGDAAASISARDPSSSGGGLPKFAERLLNKLGKAQTDWRTILNEFVQEETVDYSFSPPDRRFDGDFILPDFNDKEEKIENVLFMVDTSASMTDKMIAAAYSEMVGAIEQFGGKLKGWLGFFESDVVEPQPFTSEDELCIIRPKGGGGTDFFNVFKYLKKHEGEPPSSLIILTDGYATFPAESAAMGIPTLWLINNNDVTPPWGKIARIKV